MILKIIGKGFAHLSRFVGVAIFMGFCVIFWQKKITYTFFLCYMALKINTNLLRTQSQLNETQETVTSPERSHVFN